MHAEQDQSGHTHDDTDKNVAIARLGGFAPFGALLGCAAVNRGSRPAGLGLRGRSPMSYLVLARKWRPKTFDEVVGQATVVRTLKNALASGRIGHAFLFSGARGVGKTTTARILAKALNCEKFDKPTTTPCGRCRSCEAIARGDDIDVIEIDAASNRGIDEVRRIIEPALAALAAQRITPEELEALRPLSDLPLDDTIEQHIERDTNFHVAIAAATKNTVLQIVLSSISDLLRESRRRSFLVPGELVAARDWHHVVFEAIERHDAEAARQAGLAYRMDPLSRPYNWASDSLALS